MTSQDQSIINWATTLENRQLKKGYISVLPETSSLAWWDNGKAIGVYRVYLPSNTDLTGHVERIRS